jgi:cytochrome oxidase Cu insertion factor (SCO1/SenC/PrrC family)
VSGDRLALLALLVALVAGAEFGRRIRRVSVPARRIAFDLAWLAALALGAAAFARGTGWAGALAAGTACALGAVMLLLRLQSAQLALVPRVAVGLPVLDFSAPDEHGRPFSLASLAGRPFLLKFFRGHW